MEGNGRELFLRRGGAFAHLQFGGQAYSEVVFFKDRAALDNFTRGRLKLDAQASAIALTARASGDLAQLENTRIASIIPALNLALP